jgi:hypothetical protein
LGAEAVAASPYLARLTSLYLNSNGIGAAALAASPYLRQVSWLYVERNQIGTDAEQALRQRFGNRLDLSWLRSAVSGKAL